MSAGKKLSLLLVGLLVVNSLVILALRLIPWAVASNKLGLQWLLFSGVISAVSILWTAIIAIVWARVVALPAAHTMIVALIAFGSLVGHCMTFTVGVREQLFLQSFARRVEVEVGTNQLSEAFQKIEKEVGSGLQKDFILRGDASPKSIRSLFPQGHGTVVFDNEKQVKQIAFLWGGPIFRWGIEKSLGPVSGGVQTVREVSLGTNVVCFIAQ